MDRKRLGDYGEKIACSYLAKKGYEILERNYFKELSNLVKGEIDIIVKKKKTICFVEVKTIKDNQDKFLNSVNSGFFNPEDKVDFEKQKQLLKFAEIWLGENNIFLESNWQIDVVSVRVNLETQKAKIKHFENIVSKK
ncbi:MAG: YraN family protein [Candidatus Nealsonbacteria bacterium]